MTQYTPTKTNMTMENPPLEDVFPIENRDFPVSHVSFRECNFHKFSLQKTRFSAETPSTSIMARIHLTKTPQATQRNATLDLNLPLEYSVRGLRSLEFSIDFLCVDFC